MDPNVERRRIPRYPIDVRVSVISMRGGSLQRSLVRSHEMSERGMSVVSPLELPLQQSVEIEFTLPGLRSAMRLKAIVRNRTGSRYGVEFMSITDAQKRDIQKAGQAAISTTTASLLQQDNRGVC